MKNLVIKHPIQKHILSILSLQKVARFKDMRPPKYDTNLYSYHLTKLVHSGYVKKTGPNYSLDTAGLIYAQSSNEHTQTQASLQVMLMFVVQNSDGDTLLVERHAQPYIGSLTLPGVELHYSDSSLLGAAKRFAQSTLRVKDSAPYHAGDCYVRVRHGSTIITNMLVHVFTFNTDDIRVKDSMTWVQPHKLPTCGLAPGIDQIIARTFFRDPFYFEEFDAKC